MYYTVYQTICLVNGKTYIGCHKTANPNDSYLGSGITLGYAIKKYGRGNFKKEVLFIFDNPQEMLDKERELVVVDREKTYNLIRGGGEGRGTWDEDRLRRVSQKGNDALRQKYLSDPESKRIALEKREKSRAERLSWDENLRKVYREHLAKVQPLAIRNAASSESCLKRRNTLSKIKFQQGENNSRYDTCWISRDGEKPKSVKKEDLQKYLAEGWAHGRDSGFEEALRESGRMVKGEWFWIQKAGESSIMIKKQDLEEYLSLGWSRGKGIVKLPLQICAACKTEFQPSEKGNRFCGYKCSNSNRRHSEETKQKQRDAQLKKLEEHRHKS